MASAQPHRHAIPESSREKAERLLPQLKSMEFGDRKFGDWIATLTTRIYEADKNPERSDSFYLLRTRTDTALKEVLQLGMIGDPNEQTPYRRQQVAKLSESLRDVFRDWRNWGLEWEGSLPGEPQTRFGLGARDQFLRDVFSEAYGIVQRDGRIDSLYEKGHKPGIG